MLPRRLRLRRCAVAGCSPARQAACAAQASRSQGGASVGRQATRREEIDGVERWADESLSSASPPPLGLASLSCGGVPNHELGLASGPAGFGFHSRRRLRFERLSSEAAQRSTVDGRSEVGTASARCLSHMPCILHGHRRTDGCGWVCVDVCVRVHTLTQQSHAARHERVVRGHHQTRSDIRV